MPLGLFGLAAQPVAAGWNSIERASWIVTLIGIPIASLVALWQLGGIRRELGAKADAIVGFDLQGTSRSDLEVKETCDLIAIWSSEANLSEPATIDVFIANKGRRSAGNVFLNLVLPAGFGAKPFSEMEVARLSTPVETL